MPTRREPIFNVPGVLIGTLGAMVLVHVVRTWLLTRHADSELLLWFAFIPARYATLSGDWLAPDGVGPDVWTFFTYALIHGDLVHLSLNGVWLLAFGTPVARRFGPMQFLAFVAATAAAGAGVHLLTHAQEVFPMVGASATISGCMAAAMRFMFQGEGLAMLRFNGQALDHAPAAPLLRTLREPRVVIFIAVWFGLNLLFGVGSISLTDGDQNIAWEAHIGGFLAGLLLFVVFDPVPRQDRVSDHDDADEKPRPLEG